MEDRILSEEEFKVEEFIHYFNNLEKLAKTQDNQIKLLHNMVDTRDQLYAQLLKILVIEDDEKKFKMLDLLHSLVMIEIDKTPNDCLKVFSDIVWELRNHVQFEKTYWKLKDNQEFHLYPLFKNNISRFIEGAEVIKVSNKKGHIPDCWIKVNGEETPVEIKKGDFNLKALKQLQRYMDVYKKKKGIAVGKQLTTKLPQNVTFISIKDLEGLK